MEWCPSCASSSSFPLPQFFARLSSVDHSVAFPLGSSGLQLWWWSLRPCAARAQSSAITSWWWWSPYCLACTVLRGHSWVLARRCVGLSWGLSCERATSWQGYVQSMLIVEKGQQYAALAQLQLSLDTVLHIAFRLLKACLAWLRLL